MCRRSGFTLIELLVVIAIIAILAAILFPVFMLAKERGRQAKCLSNMRQVASALIIYKGDWDGNWPYCWYSASDPNPTIQSYGHGGYAFWMWMLKPYIKSRHMFRCPSAKRKYNNFADQSNIVKSDWSAVNYGINEYLVHSSFGKFHSDSALKYPSKTALIADCMATMFNNWTDPGVPTTGPDGITLSTGMLRIKYAESYDSSFDKGIPRHNGEQIIFADCHAQSVRLEAFKQYNDAEYPIIHPTAKLAR